MTDFHELKLCPDPQMQLQVMNVAWDAVEADGMPILVAQTGSRAYGTHHDGSDYDFKGVYVARNDRMFSLRQPAQTRDLSEPYDIVLYELAHFCKLAAAANPTVLEILWSENRWQTEHGNYLRAMRSLFLSKRIVKTYGGYAMGQLEKARKGTGGSRGQEHLQRDKFKMHTLRLLLCGIEALRTGEIPVALRPDQIELVKQAGTAPLESVEESVKRYFALMDEVAKTSALPDTPNIDLIDRAMLNIRTSGKV